MSPPEQALDVNDKSSSDCYWCMSEMELLAKSGLRSEGQVATKAPFISSDWQPHDDNFLDALIFVNDPYRRQHT